MGLRLFSNDAQWQDNSQWARIATQEITFTCKKLWGLSDTETRSPGDCEASTLVYSQNTTEHQSRNEDSFHYDEFHYKKVQLKLKIFKSKNSRENTLENSKS